MLLAAALAPAVRHVWYDNSLESWLTAAITAGVLFFVFTISRRLLVARLSDLSTRSQRRIDEIVAAVVRATRIWVLLVVSILIGADSLTLPSAGDHYLGQLAVLVLLWQTALWGGAAVAAWARHRLERQTSDAADHASVAMIKAMSGVAHVVVWLLVVVTALEYVFDVHITALVMSLGVGGIALALAVQNILGDILAALAIVFDKPFDVGDSIGVDTMSGTVEHIGLKTTRIRSTSGEQIIIGNADLLKSRLRNYRRMTQRRVLFSLDVTYDTTPEVLGKLPAVVEQIVSAQAPVRFDRSHVASFGDSAIRLETVYYVLDADYKLYMDIQQAINLDVLRRFTAEQVKFAFPSRTVYVESSGPPERTSAPAPTANS
jgi:small-conductance mechanosensitive channel